ncbi:hypothetical protein GGS21DRAFT_489109 [Xylaria nigripes]|nr:hypothetical protein GGS21DRAFT_489109 [Xylaria nigripes]
MTSTASQQPANPASNNTAAPAATSYASAAGAAKKPSSTPVVATGSNPPVVAGGSSAPPPNNAKSFSVSPMNGRPNIMPAVPAVAHGTSTLNGQNDHNRKSSVTMSMNAPNTYSANGGSAGAKPEIQFRYQESPAPSHSIPQHPSAPVPIPGASGRGVTEPRHSPSPIPQPSASGGRPPSGAPPANSMLSFGSLENERNHMRTPSASQDPGALGPQHSPHIRRGSNVSDMSNHAGPLPGMGRGNFSGGSRGGRPYNNGGYNQSMGYPPNNYNRGQQANQGRGGMPPNFAGNGRQPHPFNPPPQQNRSPAMASAMPQPMSGIPPQMPNYYYNQPNMGPTQVPHQMFPSSVQLSFERMQYKNKKKGLSRDSEKYSNQHRRAEFPRYEQDIRPRRFSRRAESRIGVTDELRHAGRLRVDSMEGPSVSDPPIVPFSQAFFNPPMAQELGHLDLSPESGNFDRLLTSVKQNYYQNPYDPRNGMQPIAGPHGFPSYPGMHTPGSPLPHFQQPHLVSAPFNPAGQPMSRSNSGQISDQRPASSTSQSQGPVAQGTPQHQTAQLKPVVAQSPHFTRPIKRNAAITIKNEAGEAIDFKNLKNAPPASPASTSQQSRTPPVVSSTPTPPPKASTPKSFVSGHGRTDSTPNLKTAEEKRNEFMEKIKQTATGDKAKDDEVTKAAADKPAPEAQSDPVISGNSESSEKVKEVSNEKSTTGAEEQETAVIEPVAPKTSDLTSEEEIERIIREMEEADAKREKEEEERRIKKQAEVAANKKAEEEARVANAAENDRKLREQEREMERLEEERERKRAEGGVAESAAELLRQTAASQDGDAKEKSPTIETAAKPAIFSLGDKSTASSKPGPSSRAPKPHALNLAPINTKTVEAPQPSAALQSLRTARLLDVIKTDIYPPGINSPNPALNAAVAKKGTSFKYDSAFLLQFKTVFTDQPSLDFHQQVKNLIGDGDGGRSASNRSAGGSGRQNTRGPGSTSNFLPMGSFGAGGVQQLPAGTTSAQRFEMSNKAMSGRTGVNPMASFARPGGAFAGGSQMSRTPSSSMGSMPHSPRQPSRRNPSKPNALNAKAEAQAAKNMPLTQGLKIEALQTSSTGWKPLSVGKGAPSNVPVPSNLMEPAMVQRKVKAALNKMTPENFDRISDQILEIAAQSKEETDGRTLRQVIQLTFEKATDEAHWASMYAKFCKKMLETMSPDVRDENIRDRLGNVVSGGALFRKYLLNRCQEEFERGWKVQLSDPKEGEDKKGPAAALLSDEYYAAAAAKRRGLGLVQFIGELYKLGMLTERIMHECVRKLVDYSGIPDEAEVESLCKLLRTIGGNLDADKGKPMMDAYFQRIQSMIELPGLPSRLQFMLMDIVDLRKANWVSKEANKGPKTLEEVRAEAEAVAAQKAAEAARSNQRGGGGRAQLGRGDARHLPGLPPQIPNQIGMDDLRRLKGGTSRPASTNLTTLGPMSMLTSRSNSGRRLGPGGSLSRGADDSGASSRTGTPPVRETPTSTNSFGPLANMDSEHPGSPPSTAVSPALAKAIPETDTTAQKGDN